MLRPTRRSPGCPERSFEIHAAVTEATMKKRYEQRQQLRADTDRGNDRIMTRRSKRP